MVISGYGVVTDDGCCHVQMDGDVWNLKTVSRRDVCEFSIGFAVGRNCKIF